MLTKKERLEKVFRGETPDRMPVSAWRHFTEDEHSGAKRWADKLLEFQAKYDWDFLKLQPRASLFCEVWGQKYDYDNYGKNVVAPCTEHLLDYETLGSDLAKIKRIDNSPVLDEAAEGVSIAVKALPDVPVFQTIFCPGAIFEMFFGALPSGRYRATSRTGGIVEAITRYPEETALAMQNITDTLIAYVKKLKEIGTYGIFHSSAALARDGYLTLPEWEKYVKKYDIQLIEAMKPMKVMLHTCGIHANPERFVAYPIDILHWADSADGNPKLADSAEWIKNIVPAGGCDERLFGQNKAEEIAELSAATLRKMGKRPFVLCPDCSLSVKTTDEEIKAFRNSVER